MSGLCPHAHRLTPPRGYAHLLATISQFLRTSRPRAYLKIGGTKAFRDPFSAYLAGMIRMVLALLAASLISAAAPQSSLVGSTRQPGSVRRPYRLPRGVVRKRSRLPTTFTVRSTKARGSRPRPTYPILGDGCQVALRTASRPYRARYSAMARFSAGPNRSSG